MRIIHSGSFRLVGKVLVVALLAFAAAQCQGVELVSTRVVQTSTTAGGDTFVVAVSPGGEYALLNSNARNLTTNAPAHPLAARVYVRDVVANAISLVEPDYPMQADFFGLSISSDGRYVLLQAVPIESAGREILLVDRQTSTTTIVNRPANGTLPNGPAMEAVMTPDAKCAAFVSGASNIVNGDTNRIDDVFLRDTTSGNIVAVSKGAASSASLDSSFAPVITPDGSKVLFASTAVKLAPDVPSISTRYTDLYLYDRAQDSVQWVSRHFRALLLAYLGVGQGDAYGHCMSDDGRYVAYLASARGATSALVLRFDTALGQTDVVFTNAAAGGLPFRETALLSCSRSGRYLAFVANESITNAVQSVMIWDASSGGLSTVSENLANTTGTNIFYSAPVVSDDGNRVVFMSDSKLLATNSLVGRWHVFLRDRFAGETRVLDVAANGASTGESVERVLISTNASHAYFHSLAALVPGDWNGGHDAYHYVAGAASPLAISTPSASLESASSSGANWINDQSIDARGMNVAFTSTAEDIIPGDINTKSDVFVRHLVTGATTLVSVNTNGVSASGGSFDAAISPDGRFVVLASAADDIVPGDTNIWADVFLRDIEAGTTRMINVLTNGTAGARGNSSRPMVSAGGRYVLFFSWARNLVPNAPLQQLTGENLFLRDVHSNVTYALTRNWCGPAITYTPDFSRIGFQAQDRLLPRMSFQVWDSASKSIIVSNAALSGASAVLSGSGLWYAGWSSNQSMLTAHKVDGSTNIIVYAGHATAPSPAILKFTPDARRLVFTTWSNTFSQGLLNPTTQLFLYDLPTGALRLISHTHTNDSVAASGNTINANITADGGYVVFASNAPDIVPGDTNGIADLFVFDSQTGVTTMIEPAFAGPESSSFGTFAMATEHPRLVLEHRGDTLLAHDYNNSTDIFATLLPVGAFSVEVTVGQQGDLLLSWPASPGKRYAVQFKENLGDVSWNNLDKPISVQGARASATDRTTSSQRFYRVTAE